MEVLKNIFLSIRDFFLSAALLIYIVPLCLACKICGVYLDE